MYDFVWTELCDWYLELSKPALRGDEGESRKAATQGVLLSVFRDVLLLLHPFVPFVTEELWRSFPFDQEFLIRQPWPEATPRQDQDSVLADMGTLQEVVRGIRNLRSEARLTPQQTVKTLHWRFKEAKTLRLLEENGDLVKLLTRVETFFLLEPDAAKPEKSLALLLPQGDIFLQVGDLLDVEKEVQRLRGEEKKLQGEIARSESKLSNPSFLERAPEDVVAKERETLEEARARLARVASNLESLAS